MMIFGDERRLRILGIVEDVLLSEFLNENVKSDSSSIWAFVDFSLHDVPLGFSFEFVGSVSNSADIEVAFVRIDKVFDSFGNMLVSGIPKGFKSICKFTFYPFIPNRVLNLPVLDGWQPSEKAIDLIGVQNPHIEQNLSFELIELILYIFYVNELSHLKHKSIGKSDLFQLISEKYFNKEEKLYFNIKMIIPLLIAKGFLKLDEKHEKLVIQ